VRESIPVECQVVTWNNFDRVAGLNVAHDIASQIDQAQILDGRIVVSALAGCAVVGWDADALEESLVHAVDVDTLFDVSLEAQKFFL
jgi:predicted RNA methylase